MKTPPPRRHYSQMVRVVREGQGNFFKPRVPYQLGKAYGSEKSLPSETRVRSLDEIGINGRSIAKPQAPNQHNNYDRRSSTVLYHQISNEQQQYFNGITPKSAPTRQDATPGTKSRTFLSSTIPAQAIRVGEESIEHNNKDKKGKHYHSALNKQSSPVNNGFNYEQPSKRQNLLPSVKTPSLAGIAQTPLNVT